MSVISSSILAGASGSAGGGDPLYVDDVFSTTLYTGTQAEHTINTGIDNTDKSLVWIKSREDDINHTLCDTVRGAGNYITTNSSSGSTYILDVFRAFTSNGFTVKDYNQTNRENRDFVAWNFKAAPGFFDVVTWTGSGSDKTISHNLGSVPGCIVVKCTSHNSEWYVYHRSLPTATQNWLRLSSTGAANGPVGQDMWGPPSSTTFKADTYLGHSTVGRTYVAYIFAHDDASFGTGGDESIIKCGSYSSTGFVDLGWEPQWVMIKSTSQTSSYTGEWRMVDNMRGIKDGDDNQLFANHSRPEDTSSFGQVLSLNPTGFTVESQGNYGTSTIYMAIRRPNKPLDAFDPPLDATEVFNASTRTGTGAAGTVIKGFNYDIFITKRYNASGWQTVIRSRLQGQGVVLDPASSSSESTATNGVTDYISNGFIIGADSGGSYSNTTNFNGSNQIDWTFKRAPGFMDVVAYTGNGVAGRNITHNLEVEPELIIIKNRGVSSRNWITYVKPLGNQKSLELNSTAIAASGTWQWNATTPTSSVFTVGLDSYLNGASEKYIAYLFATLPGISKVGSYTGTGSAINVNCGFTAGARFILIKRTDSSGDWYVWDTARGIVSGNDPYLLLNSTAAQVTNTDYIDPLSTGFTVTSSAPAALNTSGGTYIFLAIA